MAVSGWRSPEAGGGGEGDKEESEVPTFIIMWTATVVVHTPLITLHITLIYFMATNHIPSFLAGAMMQLGQHVLMNQSSMMALTPHKLVQIGPPLTSDPTKTQELTAQSTWTVHSTPLAGYH